MYTQEDYGIKLCTYVFFILYFEFFLREHFFKYQGHKIVFYVLILRFFLLSNEQRNLIVKKNFCKQNFVY